MKEHVVRFSGAAEHNPNRSEDIMHEEDQFAQDDMGLSLKTCAECRSRCLPNASVCLTCGKWLLKTMSPEKFNEIRTSLNNAELQVARQQEQIELLQRQMAAFTRTNPKNAEANFTHSIK
ncbi:MAG TPA: hypothetical protein VJZ71_17645 [Phycisphaerae bacterium]|nr:hypothetical protein [Phycisphaerae bacterium]